MQLPVLLLRCFSLALLLLMVGCRDVSEESELAKEPGQATIEEMPDRPPMEGFPSKFLPFAERQSPDGLSVWVLAIAEENDELVSSRERDPGRRLLTLYFQLKNTLGFRKTLVPQAITADFRGNIYGPFLGEYWEEVDSWLLAPRVVQINGESVVLDDRPRVRLSDDDTAVLRVNFPVSHARTTEEAIAEIDRLIVPYLHEGGGPKALELWPDPSLAWFNR